MTGRWGPTCHRIQQLTSTGPARSSRHRSTTAGPRESLGEDDSTTQRLAIAAVQVLGLAVWFSMSAVVPSVQADWGISSAQAVWLTGTVQLGFVTGALASTVLNLADRCPPHILMAASAALAAGCTFALAALADGLLLALALRFLTGVFLAGVYPVGIKLMASWAPTANRGLAMGLLIGALTIGSTLPHLVGGLVTLPWREVLQVTAAIGLAGAVVALLVVRAGPHLSTGAVALHPRYALAMFAEAGPRRVNLGYFGHMWELYALWTWVSVFVLHSHASAELGTRRAILVFVTMGLFGLAGCLIGGWAADRYGRSAAAVTALSISGACCLLSPLAFLAPLPVLAIFFATWGAAVIADSGVFSTALSEVADQRFVGTALSAQTAIGFALTVASIQLVPLLAGAVGWQYAFLVLALGPAIGAPAMRRAAAGLHATSSSTR
ncbi:MFS transporter [Nocardioides sp. JQ2195]|uniref:MFS transporter n=1 Tax=Nocardioides sp. JQ2195 TaxID=2592334 RepID=UPI00143EA55C|nr:MFS transporter [Nocardioides sp. JQ2195]QIX26474.1 MFS transporter [Nocardioides sp. JQ2195]